MREGSTLCNFPTNCNAPRTHKHTLTHTHTQKHSTHTWSNVKGSSVSGFLWSKAFPPHSHRGRHCVCVCVKVYESTPALHQGNLLQRLPKPVQECWLPALRASPPRPLLSVLPPHPTHTPALGVLSHRCLVTLSSPQILPTSGRGTTLTLFSSVCFCFNCCLITVIQLLLKSQRLSPSFLF